MMFANRISSSTSGSIWLPETSRPTSARGSRPRFQSCNTPPEVFEAQKFSGLVGNFTDRLNFSFLDSVLDRENRA
jgi:hypothetical protein